MVDGYSEPYHSGRNRNGGMAPIYILIQEDTPSKLLVHYKLPHDILGFFVELNLRKKKRLLFGLYHQPSQSDEYGGLFCLSFGWRGLLIEKN